MCTNELNCRSAKSPAHGGGGVSCLIIITSYYIFNTSYVVYMTHDRRTHRQVSPSKNSDCLRRHMFSYSNVARISQTMHVCLNRPLPSCSALPCLGYRPYHIWAKVREALASVQSHSALRIIDCTYRNNDKFTYLITTWISHYFNLLLNSSGYICQYLCLQMRYNVYSWV